MKVAVHLDGTTVRGNERQVMLVGRGLQRRGHRVLVACRGAGPVREYIEAHGLETAAVRPRGDLDFFSVLRFALWLRRERPDAVLLTSWRRAFVAGLAARLAGVPCIVQRLGGPHAVRRGPGGWKQRLALTRWPHRVVVNSEGLREQVVAQLPRLRREVVVVPSGLEAEPAEARDLRPELSLSSGSVVLLSVGGLEPLKGHDLLVEALARLDSEVHAAIAGGGSADQCEALRVAARAAGVADRLHLLGYRTDVPALLAGCDAFVHTSRVDSLPNAVLEAMAAARPIVASRVPGMAEALESRHGRSPAGWVVPSDDPEALAATLGDVVNGIRRSSNMVRARASEARWRIENIFTLERMIDGYQKVLQGEAGSGNA